MDPAVQKMIENLEIKYGKPLSEWISIVNNSQLEKHGEILKLLKGEEYGLTHGYANMIAHLAKDTSAVTADDDQMVSDQYKGKDGLKSFYDQLMKEVLKFGKDVEVAPKKAYVSLRRKKQFALIQPSTKSRLDIGINLKGKDPEGKLEASGSFNSMCSHRVRIENEEDIDKSVINWLKEAYEAAG